MVFKQIIVPFDGSKGAVKALKTAGELAKRDRAKLLVTYVRESLPVPTVPSDSLLMLDRHMEEVARLELKKAEHILEKVGVSAEVLVLTGHPADEIVGLAEKSRADLIVMGSRGLSGIDRFLLGSVSESVMRHARCAVMVVK